MTNRTISLDEEGLEKLSRVDKNIRLRKIFNAVAAVGAVLGITYAGITSPEDANILFEGYKAAVIASLANAFFNTPVFQNETEAKNSTRNHQRIRFMNQYRELVSQAQDEYMKELQMRKTHELTDADISALATLPKSRLNEVPDWVPMNAMAKIERERAQMGSLTDHYSAQATKAIKATPARTQSASEDPVFLLKIVSGLLPFFNLLQHKDDKAPAAESFDISEPQKPAIADLAEMLKSKPKP